MPEGPLTLAVDLTNIFGVQSASSLTLKKKNASESPLFQLDHSLRSFTPGGGFKVEAAPLPSGCPGAKVCVVVVGGDDPQVVEAEENNWQACQVDKVCSQAQAFCCINSSPPPGPCLPPPPPLLCSSGNVQVGLYHPRCGPV